MNYLPNTGLALSATSVLALFVTGSVLITVGLALIALFFMRKPDTGD